MLCHLLTKLELTASASMAQRLTDDKVFQWVKHGDFSTCYAPHPGRPKTVTTPEIIDQIHELIFEDCRISDKSIAE